MALTAAAKAQIVKTHQRAKSDTGSPEVQIAILTARIDYLTKHLKVNTHDFHTRHGLTNLVSQRRRMMAYFKRKNLEAYRKLLADLEIRG
jgi:small subunit ribosomal protein S15